MNFKTPFKVLTTAALIGTLSLSAVAPGVASAADKTVTAQAETPANFALEKVILVKGDSKISVSFDTYIDVLGNEKALNGYELAYVVAANGEVFALDTYVDFYEAGNTEEEVVEKLSKAGKTSEVTEVKDGAFNDGKLEPVEPAVIDPKVESVTAINAKTVEVKFNKAIKATSVSGATITLDSSTVTKELSEDGKTLTLTLATPLTKEATDVKVVIKDLTDLNDNKVEAYAKVVSLKDDVRPTLGETSFVDSQTLKVVVSEPLNATTAEILAAASLTDEDGSPVDTDGLTDSDITYDIEDGYFVISLANLTTPLEAGKYKLKFTGLKDYAGNLINPNPVTKEITVAEDEVAPTIESISNVGLDASDNGYLKVNFSEPVDLDLTTNNTVSVSLNGATAANADVVQVSDDKKSVVLKFTTPSTSYQTVVIDKGAVTDLAGNENKKFSGSVTFKATTPVVKEYSYSVSKDKETVTFDRDLVDGAITDLTGTKLLDNVETSVADIEAEVIDGKLVIDTSSLGKGEYTLSLPVDTVADIAGQGNKELKLKFTLDKAAATAQTEVLGFATDATGSALITGTSPVQADGFVYVKFGASVGASAVDVANYTVEGQQVFSKAVFTSTTKNIVKLTLKSDTIVKDGDYTLDIKNVKDAKEKAVKAFTGEFTFDDNTAPTFTALKFDTNATVGTTGAKLTATFSEALAASTSGTAVTPTAQQFKATVNGVVTKIEAIAVTGNKIEFELDKDKALEANDKVEITVLEDATFTDASVLSNVIKGGQAKSVTIK